VIEVRAPRPGEAEVIAARAAEPWARQANATGYDFEMLADRPLTFVGLFKNEPVALGGYIDFGYRAAIGWSIIPPPPPGVLLPLVRVVRANLKATPFNWIEAHCVEDFEPAIRWVRTLGFELVDGPQIMIEQRIFKRFVWVR
jgi:hypothetical protein